MIALEPFTTDAIEKKKKKKKEKKKEEVANEMKNTDLMIGV